MGSAGPLVLSSLNSGSLAGLGLHVISLQTFLLPPCLGTFNSVNWQNPVYGLLVFVLSTSCVENFQCREEKERG